MKDIVPVRRHYRCAACCLQVNNVLMVLFVSIISSRNIDRIYSPISHFPFAGSFSFLVYDSIRSIYAHAITSEHANPQAVNHFGTSTVYLPSPKRTLLLSPNINRRRDA